MARNGVSAQIHPGLAQRMTRSGKAKRVMGNARVRKSGKITLRGATKAIASATVTRKPAVRLEQHPTAKEQAQRDLQTLYGEIKEITVVLKRAVHDEQEAQDGRREQERT